MPLEYINMNPSETAVMINDVQRAKEGLSSRKNTLESVCSNAVSTTVGDIKRLLELATKSSVSLLGQQDAELDMFIANMRETRRRLVRVDRGQEGLEMYPQ